MSMTQDEIHAKINCIGFQLANLRNDLKHCNFVETRTLQEYKKPSPQNEAIAQKQIDAVLDELELFRLCVPFICDKSPEKSNIVRIGKAA